MGEEDSENGKKTREIHFDSNAEIDAGIAELKTKNTWGLQADNKIARQIILEYVRGNKKDEDKDLLKGLKEITVAYKGRCLKGDNCVRKNPEIQVGERALYGKGVGLLCLECRDALEDRGDRDLLKRHHHIRYCERLIKQLKQEVETKSREAELLDLPKREADLIEKDKELAKKLDEYVRKQTEPNPQNPLTREQEMRFIDDMLNTHLEVARKIKDIDGILEQRLKRKKTQKQIEDVQPTA